ncbi:MAG: regulatory protein RecX [Rhizobacter sp.]|nr:regulatory protein RecX [Chlorobiales bacterium]
MIITKIEYQKNDRDRISIFIDGEFAFGVSEELLLKFALKKGQEVEPEQVKAWMAEKEYFEAKTSALNYLSMRVHSTKELKDKLKKKGFGLDAISRVLVRLEELGLTDDKRFAEVLLRDKLRKPIGKRRLQQELYKKGIKRDMASEVMEATDLNADALCQTAAERKLRSLQKEPDKQKAKRKLIDFLMRRGFEWEVIRPVVEKLFN